MGSKNNLNSLESKPLKTLEEILDWQQFVVPFEVEKLRERTKFSVSGKHSVCHYNEDLKWDQVELCMNAVPRTLVCHDMKGGYSEDRFTEGTESPDAYKFFHWAGVDLFVYFSHHLLTIPPPVWITAGHVNSVKVLGTFITEWTDGANIWKQIFSSEDISKSCVEQMVNICEKFGFDGYLLNVENPIESENVGKLMAFIEELQTALHERLPHAELIWYDSVITTGELKWQNELNEKNMPFFERCDGILLNYVWNEDRLARSAAAAGDRAGAVFAGVDVWGRGSFGGGGFGAAEALAAAREAGLSVGVFAPAWTHEAFDGRHFACTELLFWKALWPHMYIHGPAELPLITSFCQGWGRRGSANFGSPPSPPDVRPWFNLGRQQLQPTISSCLDQKCTPRPDRPPPPPKRPEPKPEEANAGDVKKEHEEGESENKVVKNEDNEPEDGKGEKTETLQEINAAEKNDDNVREVKMENEEEAETLQGINAAEKNDDNVREVKMENEEEAETLQETQSNGPPPSKRVKEEVFASAPAPSPAPAPAPACGGSNRGCVQHWQWDAFHGGGSLLVRRVSTPGARHEHRLLVCDLRSTSGILRVVYAAKRVQEYLAPYPVQLQSLGPPIRLALVLRNRPGLPHTQRLVWLDEYTGRRVQRSADGTAWEPEPEPEPEPEAEAENPTPRRPVGAWDVWRHMVPAHGHVVGVLAELPGECESSLLGWLEISDPEAADPAPMQRTTGKQ